MNRWVFALTAAAALALAACSGGGPNGPVVCDEVAIPAFYMVYPAPNATNVPVSLAALDFAGTPLSEGSDTSAIELSVDNAPVATVDAFATAPTPLPSPDRSPLPPPPYVGVAIPALSPNTTYTVTYQYTIAGPGACAGTVDIPQGSFTTQ